MQRQTYGFNPETGRVEHWYRPLGKGGNANGRGRPTAAIVVNSEGLSNASVAGGRRHLPMRGGA